MKNNKAEIATSQLITFMLVLAGFVILLVAFYQFSFTGLVDREACHTSVILRSTASQVAGSLAQGYVPLKCQIKKMCVTSKFFGKGVCDDFKNFKGITKAKVSDIEDVNRVISQEVLECWKMMGEGKVDLFTQSKASLGIGEVYPTCVICSRIAFDKTSLDKNKIDLSQVDPKEYMQTHKVPEKEISYAQYISSSPGKFSSESNPLKLPIKLDEKNVIDPKDIPIGEVSKPEEATTQELAILFMQISAPSTSSVVDSIGNLAVAGAAGVGTASILSAPVRSFVLGSIRFLGNFCITPIGAVTCGAIVVFSGGYIGANIYSNRELALGKCEDVLVGKEGRNGCSVVRVTPYNVTDLKKYCAVIEGVD